MRNFSTNGNPISWFYIRQTYNPTKGWLPITETHRVGCIAMEKLPNGKMRIAFSLCRGVDRFVAAVGRESALGKLKSPTRSFEIEWPKLANDLEIQCQALGQALYRNDFSTLAFMSNKNQSAFEGALKELLSVDESNKNQSTYDPTNVDAFDHDVHHSNCDDDYCELKFHPWDKIFNKGP